MQCKRKGHINPETGEQIYVPKRVFKNHKEAEIECIRINMNKRKCGRYKRLMTYKCTECGKFHIGRSNKKITEAYKRSVTKKVWELSDKIKLKVVGKIDLT